MTLPHQAYGPEPVQWVKGRKPEVWAWIIWRDAPATKIPAVAAGWNDREILEGLGWNTSTLVGFGIALAITLGTYLHPRTHALSLDVASELMKVTWPSWGETRVSTFAVVIASLVAAVILFGIDTFSYWMMVETLPGLWARL